MKNILVLLSLCWTIGAIAQSDSVSLGAGATNMVFYNVATGTKTVAANDDWHLAFSVKPAIPPYNTNQSAAIRINEAYGLKLFRSPNQKLDVWSSFDTTGYTSWQQMHNPDTTWTIGAFNINKNFGDDYNYGWGEYVFALHSVESDSSIYLLQLPDGEFRKFAILNLDYDTVFNVQYDKLDNSDFTAGHIEKKPYRTKSFVYYNLETKTVMDKEPAVTTWDMVFTRYNNTTYNSSDLSQDMGVLTNDANKTYVASGATAQQQCYNGSGSSYINTIGKSWMSSTAPDSLSYFVSGNISGNFKFTMTVFDGSYNGLMGFNTNRCAATGVADIMSGSNELTAYPVPASDVLNVKLMSASESTVSIQLLDMSGRVISAQTASMSSGTNNMSINTSTLQSGNYILSVSSETYKMNRMVTVVK
jgi:hypothetical protein